jgi:hypothetical protein
MGCADGSFASREEAEAAALAVAKRIVDSLESPTQVTRSQSRSLGILYGDWLSRLAFYFLHEVQNMGKFRVRDR